MALYIAIIILLLCLSYHYDVRGNTKKKILWFRIVLLLFVLVAGLRYRLGVDTCRYITKFYHETPYLWKLESDMFSIGSDPFFFLLNSFVYTVGGRFFIVQIIQSLFVNLLIFHYIRIHSPYLFTCVFFYFVWIYFPINMEEMRAGIAVAISLYANDKFARRNYMKGIVLVLIACSFHISALLILFTSLFPFLKLNIVGLFFLIFAFCLGRIMQPIIEDFMPLLSFSDIVYNKVDSYIDNPDGFSRELNIFGYVLNLFPYLFVVYYLNIAVRNHIDKNIAEIEHFIIVGLIFIIFTTMVPILYRYVRFFAVYIIIALSHYSIYLLKTRKKNYLSLHYIKALALLIPIIICLNIVFYRELEYAKFLPYSSIFEKSVDRRREKVYMQLREKGIYDYPSPKEF